MKIGDTVPVTIAGQVVAQATIKETADGTATLVVPATLVVMATRTELAYEAPSRDESAPETIITGVDRSSAAESAVVHETPNTDNSTQDDSTTDASTADVSAADVSTTDNSTSDSTDNIDNVAPTTPPVENVEPPTAPVGGNDETS